MPVLHHLFFLCCVWTGDELCQQQEVVDSPHFEAFLTHHFGRRLDERAVTFRVRCQDIYVCVCVRVCSYGHAVQSFEAFYRDLEALRLRAQYAKLSPKERSVETLLDR